MSDVPPSHPYQTQHATDINSQSLQQQSLSQTSQHHLYPPRYGALTSLPSPLGSNTSHHVGSMDHLSYAPHATTDLSSNTVHMYAYHPSPSTYPPSYNVGPTATTTYPYHVQPQYPVNQNPYHNSPQQRIQHRSKTNDPSGSESAESPKVHFNSMFGRSTPTYGHSSAMRMVSTMHPMMEYRVGPPLMAVHQTPASYIPSVPVPPSLGYFGRSPSRSNLDLITPQETVGTSILCGYCGTSQCQVIVQGCGHGFHHQCVLQTWTDKCIHCFTCLHAIQRLKNMMNLNTSGTVNTLATYALMQQSPQTQGSFVSTPEPSMVSPTDSSSEGINYSQNPNIMAMTEPTDLSSPTESLTGHNRTRRSSKQAPKQQRRPPPIDTAREMSTMAKGDVLTTTKSDSISLVRPISGNSTPSAVTSRRQVDKVEAQPHVKAKATRAITGTTRVTASGKKVLKVCAMPNCGRTVRSRGLCKGHGGGRRCGFAGCGLSDQGGGFCISHGGGKRCQHPDCDNSAQSRGLCKLHGGGSRCQVEGCTKSSQGAGLCRAHGGGRRCQVEGCNKTDRRAGLCVSHGMSRKCLVEDCSKTGRIDGLCSKHQYERTQTLAPLLARRQMDEGVATLAGAAFALDGEDEGQVASRSNIKLEATRHDGNDDVTEGKPSTSPAFAVMASLSLQSLFTPMASPTTPTGLMSAVDSMRTRNEDEGQQMGKRE